MRVYELARELGVSSREVLSALDELGLNGRTASSNVPAEALPRLRKVHAAALPKRPRTARSKPRSEAKAPAKARAPAKAKARAPAKAKARAPAKAKAKAAEVPREPTRAPGQPAPEDRPLRILPRPEVAEPLRDPLAPAAGVAVPALDLPLPPLAEPLPAEVLREAEAPEDDDWPVLKLVEVVEPAEPEAVERASEVASGYAHIAGRIARWLCMLAIWAVLGFGAGILLAITVPYLFGYRSLTVLSGSMQPTIATGDVVVVEPISPMDARIGDVVSFRDPDDKSRLLTHRVRRIEAEGGHVLFVTKGDANTSVEQWRTDRDGTIGRVRYVVPKLGFALYWVRGAFGRILLVVVPALLLGAYEIRRIWRTELEEVRDEAV